MATLKTLRDILSGLGLSMASYQQIRREFSNPPGYKETKPNPHGRGAQYLYDEDEVVKAVTEFRSRVRQSRVQAVQFGPAAHKQMTVREQILEWLQKYPLRKKEVQDLIGAAKKPKSVEFDLMWDDLIADEVIWQPDQFGKPGKYAIKQVSPPGATAP